MITEAHVQQMIEQLEKQTRMLEKLVEAFDALKIPEAPLYRETPQAKIMPVQSQTAPSEKVKKAAGKGK
jgi:uncharacterized protein YlaN (UPF0358 family)